MKTNKVLLGGLVGAIVYFLLGWGIYGLLLMDFMTENMNQCMMKPEEEMNLFAIFGANLAFSMFLALVFSWANVSSMADGLKIGAISGFMISLSIDLSFFAMSTMFNNITAMLIDISVSTVMTAIVGLVIVKVMTSGKAA